MTTEPRHFMDEPDIGSGEKSPGEKETEEEVRKIPERTSDAPDGDARKRQPAQ